MAIKQSITINKAVTLLPILILIVVSLVQGYIRYSHDIETAINHRVELAKVSAQPILNLMNRSVGGGNYANLQDVEALNLFKANKDIDFFLYKEKQMLKVKTLLPCMMLKVRFYIEPFILTIIFPVVRKN